MSQKFKGKAACCIEMLQILNTGMTYNATQLAELLDVNPRNIAEYAKELREVSMGSVGGFYIENVPGRYGGYRLNGKACIPPLKFTEMEEKSIDAAFNYLDKRNDFPNKAIFEKAISKVYSSISKNIFKKELVIINRYPLSMKEEDVEYRYNILNDAIVSKKAVKLKYVSQKNKEMEHIYHPYDLFMYNNTWFVIGWCETWNDIIYFKLNRMTEIEKTDKKFSIFKFYNKSDYIDEYGFKNNGEWYHIEFEAYGIYAALVKERIYGKNQEVLPIDDHATLVKVDMQNKENILAFILGFNRNLKVIEPEWLKKELVEYSDFIKETYLTK